MKKINFWLHMIFDSVVMAGFMIKYLSLRESGLLFVISFLFEIMMNDDKIEDIRDADDRFSYLALKVLVWLFLRIVALVLINRLNG
ncbi:MAG: hypothetical protein Q4A21_01135 [bacterium]|nr:hypothetical protein [bacterium]